MMHCPFCSTELKSFATFSSDLVVDVMLTPQLQKSLPELHYGKCDDCGSLSAMDIRRSDRFDVLKLYEQLPEDYWTGLETGHSDRFFSFIEQQLNPSQLPLKICDVGCGEGSLLRGLGSHWHKTGIEPGEQATEIARDPNNSIHWIQGTLSTAKLSPACFDVLTYIDVTEHLLDPMGELVTAKQSLKPGGKLLLYTGNANSSYAKLAGQNWAYLRCAGHIAVASQRALIQGLEQAGFETIQTWKQNHPSSPGFGKWLFEYAGSRIRRHWAVPLYQDHMLIIAQRPGAI